MQSRRFLGKNILGSILKFLDILDNPLLVNMFPEALPIWQQNTRKTKEAGDVRIMETRINGKLHSFNDRPAYSYPTSFIDTSGTSIDGIHQIWYYNGKIHRVDAPADISWIGEQWYYLGFRHRDGDLPAVEYSWGQKQWYRWGQEWSGPDKK